VRENLLTLYRFDLDIIEMDTFLKVMLIDKSCSLNITLLRRSCVLQTQIKVRFSD